MGQNPSHHRRPLHFKQLGECNIEICTAFEPLLDMILQGEGKVQAAIPIEVKSNNYPGVPADVPALLLTCPHCQGGVVVLRAEIASNGFRHGIFKDKSGQIPPHSSQEVVETLLKADAIWGCGQPFRIDPSTFAVTKDSWNS